MINVLVRSHEANLSADTIYRCKPIYAYGKTYVRRSSLPKLYVDLPVNIHIKGKRVYIFEVYPENNYFVLHKYNY